MAEEVKQNYSATKNEDFEKIQEWLYLCISHWYWFVLSLFIAFGIAILYLLMAQPSYTRKASILIKDEDKNRSLSTEFSQFSDFGVDGGKTNLYNEMITLSSPSYMLEVVKDLHLDMNYKTDGRFHELTLYGKTLPVIVTLPDIDADEYASFTLMLKPNNVVEMTDFHDINHTSASTKVVKGQIGTALKTPIGQILVKPTQNYIGKYDTPIRVSKNRISDVANSYAGRLVVELNHERASVVDISLSDVCPERAENILNKLFDVYNDKWVEDINKQAISTSNFIDEELSTIESQLGSVDANIAQHKSSSLTPDLNMATQINLSKVENTSSQLLELDNQIYMANLIKKQLGTRKNELLPANSGIDNAALSAQIKEYNEKVLQRNSLVENSGPKNPIVQDLDEQLNVTRNSIITSLNTVVSTLNDRKNSLESSKAQTTQKLEASPNQAKDLLSVERQQKVKEQLYLFLLQKREENQLSKAYTAYNTKLLNPPSGRRSPTSPVKINVLIIALVLGLLIPMLILFIVNNLSTKVKGRKDIEQLSLPFVGEIPLSYRMRKGLFSIFNKRREVREIVVQEKNGNSINEAFRVVRTNLEFVLGRDYKVMMLTSSNVGSGKTFVSSNLATSFAIKGKKTLLVDLDLRKASLSTFVDSPQRGISDYLNGQYDNVDDVMVKGRIHENLDVIPVGTIPPNPTELLFSDRLIQLFKNMRKIYDLIIIDCPPIDIVADASIVNNLVDVTVYVLRSGLMDRHMLPEVEKYYTEKRFNNMVILLNGTTEESNGYGYRRYGYGYGYGDNKSKNNSKNRKKK
ncbi:MAG: polysaccharide biosynthesis tyrosine autokinase [Muribaculaceae bacterium]|nr:polysaccharide biosynthesis tyrosine autokinase [Muribaculaceae bacterium]